MKARVTPAQLEALLLVAELDAQRTGSEAEQSKEQERATAAKKVPAPLLERYEALLERGRSPVAAAERGCCSGCHIRLPAMLGHEIRSALRILPCPHCGRLLYDPGHLRGTTDEPVATPPPNAR